jgi:DMSO/TMAO reductase YedYZ heme-binding membrane subunit
VRLSIPWIRGLVIAASMLPMVRLVLWPVLDRAGANPIEFVTRSSGTWTLVFLLLALSVSPLRRLTGAGWLMRLRRPLGLASFAYALAHLATWVWLEHWFEIAPRRLMRWFAGWGADGRRSIGWSTQPQCSRCFTTGGTRLARRM